MHSSLHLVLELTTTPDQFDYTCLMNVSHFGTTYYADIQICDDTENGPGFSSGRPYIYSPARWFDNALQKIAKSPSASRTLAFIHIQLEFGFEIYRSKYNDGEGFREGASLVFPDYKDLDQTLTQGSFPVLRNLTVDVFPITSLAWERIGDLIEDLRSVFPRLQERGMLAVQQSRTSSYHTCCIHQVLLTSLLLGFCSSFS